MFVADGSTSGLLYETMKAKYRLPGAVRPTEPLGIDAINSISAAMENRENTFVSLSHKNKEVAVPVAAHGNGPKIALPATSLQSMMPENVSSLVAVPSQMPQNMPPVQTTVTEIPQLNLLPGQAPSTTTFGSGELSIGDGGSGSKRRRTTRSKSTKRMRSESVKFLNISLLLFLLSYYLFSVFLICSIVLK